MRRQRVLDGDAGRWENDDRGVLLSFALLPQQGLVKRARQPGRNGPSRCTINNGTNTPQKCEKGWCHETGRYSVRVGFAALHWRGHSNAAPSWLRAPTRGIVSIPGAFVPDSPDCRGLFVCAARTRLDLGSVWPAPPSGAGRAVAAAKRSRDEDRFVAAPRCSLRRPIRDASPFLHVADSGQWPRSPKPKALKRESPGCGSCAEFILHPSSFIIRPRPLTPNPE